MKTDHDRHKTDMNITKKLIMTEHKTDMNITKKLIMTEQKTDMNIAKYKKLNMTEHKADILNTRTDHGRAQNRYEHY